MYKPRKKKTAVGAVYRIIDRAAVARVISRAVQARYNGNRTLAAKRSEIDPATLVRLCQQRQDSIRHGTYARIAQRLFEPEELAEIEAALESPIEYQLGAINAEWEILHAGEPGFCPDTPTWELGARALVVTATDPLAVGQRARERWAEYRKREKSELWNRLLPLCEAQFEALRQFAAAKGHIGMRVQVAKNRVLSPLLEQSQSGFIERSWRELSDAELIRFVRDGLARESVLLRRPALHDRAAAAARRLGGDLLATSTRRSK